jgi:hypothetical protein
VLLVVVGFERSAGVTQQPDGVIGTKTYGRVGVNKENLLVYLLDRNNELKDTKKINVFRNP